MNYKQCNYCDSVKNSKKFQKDITTSDGLSRRCIQCTKTYYRRHYKRNMNKKNSHFLYGDDVKDVLRNKQYMKDRAELFKKYGNGWWWELDKTSNDRHLNSHRLNRKRFAGKFSKEE